MTAVTRISFLCLASGLIAGCSDVKVPASTSDLGGASETVTDVSSPTDASEQDITAPEDSVPDPDTVSVPDSSTPTDTGPSGCVSDLQCDDGDPCTIDSCDVKTGFCAHENDASNPACQEATNDACTASDSPGTTDPAI